MTVIGVLCLLAARYVLLAHLSTRSDDDLKELQDEIVTVVFSELLRAQKSMERRSTPCRRRSP